MPLRRLSVSSTVKCPLIKFRYGADRVQSQKSNEAQSSTQAPNKGTLSAGQEPIYDFQLPPRFRRRLLSEEEIAYINRGGPE